MSDSSDSPDVDDNANYVVVARRYRPQTFEDLIGQQHVSSALTRAIESQRVGHAYLFTGARGVGKTSAARILAKALNCEKGTSAVPCNECEICQSVSAGEDVDVLEIDGASNRGIDEIRSLRQNVAVRPSRSRYKIYIIDEVHMLTKEAFNALLKTLEEPPEHVKFIFATTEPNKIPVTILSRCQRYDFAGIEAVAIQQRLEEIATSEGVKVDADALQILAMRAAGSMRDSQSLLEQLLSTGTDAITSADVTTMLGIAPATRLSQLVQPLVDRNPAAALAELDAGIGEGAEVSQLVDQLLGYFRDVMTQAVGCDASTLLYSLPSQQQEVGQVAEQLGVHTLLAIVQVLDQTAARMRQSTHVRTLAEMALVRICQLEDLDELSNLIAQLRTGASVSNGSVASGAPAPRTAVKKNVTPERAPASPPSEAPPVAPAPVTPAVTAPVRSDAKSEGKNGMTAPVSSAPPAVEPTAPTPEPVSVAATVATAVAETAPAVIPASENKTAGDTKGEAEPVPAVGPTPLTAGNVDAVWKRVLETLSGMIVDHASAADKITVDDGGKLTISFGESFHRDIVERPTNRQRVDEALEKVCGSKVGFAFATHKRTDAPAKPVGQAPSRRQQQAEISTHPFVKRAMELFDGDPERLRYVPPGQKRR